MVGTRQLLLCANYFRLLGNNVTTTKENIGSPLVISDGDGLLGGGGREIECTFMPGYEEQKIIILLQCGKFTCLGTTQKSKLCSRRKYEQIKL